MDAPFFVFVIWVSLHHTHMGITMIPIKDKKYKPLIYKGLLDSLG